MLTLSTRNRFKSKYAPPPKIDILLESIGLIRNVVPKDGNSLFRCISQCVFFTQSCHLIVRQDLVQFAHLKTDEFNEITQIPVTAYAKKINDTKIDGELLDMYIAAKLYQINISFYVDQNPFKPLIIKTPNPIKTMQICLNHEGSYDLVFHKESVANISFCQAIVYEMLYNKVFKLTNVDIAVKQMLSDGNFSSTLNDRASIEKRATCTDMRELLGLGITPFPFKVAKALSPELYRNSEYDIWVDNKKQKYYGRRITWEFKVGSKCLVSIDDHEYHCYIQQIHGKNEPVEVYVKDLAERICVDFSQLKLMPVDEDVRNMESPTPIDQVPTSINNDCSEFQVAEQFEPPVQYINNFIHRPTTHETLPPAVPGQIFTPTYYGQIYQQQPIASSNLNRNMMHSWYVPTPPLLSNDYHPFQEQVVLLEMPSNLNDNRIPTPNFPLPWGHQIPSVSFNDIESGVTMNYNRAYQPWMVPEVNEPANELQQ